MSVRNYPGDRVDSASRARRRVRSRSLALSKGARARTRPTWACRTWSTGRVGTFLREVVTARRRHPMGLRARAVAGGGGSARTRGGGVDVGDVMTHFNSI